MRFCDIIRVFYIGNHINCKQGPYTFLLSNSEAFSFFICPALPILCLMSVWREWACLSPSRESVKLFSFSMMLGVGLSYGNFIM